MLWQKFCFGAVSIVCPEDVRAELLQIIGNRLCKSFEVKNVKSESPSHLSSVAAINREVLPAFVGNVIHTIFHVWTRALRRMICEVLI